jgi:hypothetical protein
VCPQQAGNERQRKAAEECRHVCVVNVVEKKLIFKSSISKALKFLLQTFCSQPLSRCKNIFAFFRQLSAKLYKSSCLSGKACSEK